MKYNIIFLTVSLCISVTSLAAVHLNEDGGDFPAIEGMTIEYNYPVYTGEDLWDYINGASDGYLAYHFQNLKIAEYLDKDGNGVKVEVYALQRTEDAYGIYSTERSPDYQFVEVGAEGYAEESLVNFVVGNYYVKIILATGSESSGQTLIYIAKTVASSLSEENNLPETFAFFPADGKIAHSESFVASSVMGHEFLKDAYKVDYKVGDEAFSILVIDRDQPEDCANILKDYYTYTKEDLPTSWKNGFYVINDKYNGTISFYLQDNVLFGFVELEDQAIIERYSKMMLKNIE